MLDQHGGIRYEGVRGSELGKAIEVLLKEMGVEVELDGIDHKAEDAKALAAAKAAEK